MLNLRLDRFNWDSTYDQANTLLGQMGEWPLAQSYNVIGGRICPTGPRLIERRFPARSPLLKKRFALSFAQLGARGEPSQRRILSWVREYGLLRRKDEKRPAMHDLDDGGINQAHISVEDFRKEVGRARGLLTLYTQVLNEDTEAIFARAKQPQSIVDQELALGLLSPVKSERMGDFMSAKLSDAKHPAFWEADKVLCSLLTDATSRVRLQTLPAFEVGLRGQGRYRPRPSWYCPDLLSAIYLQIHLLITNSTTMRICENPHCRTPFPPTRKDQRFCKDGCRSSARSKR